MKKASFIHNFKKTNHLNFKLGIYNSQLSYIKSIPVLRLFGKEFRYKAFTLPPISNQDITLPDTILGKQAEAVFEYILKECSMYCLMASNIQVQGDTETLGELDYLIENTRTKQQLHIEIACKFYLFDASITSTFEGKWIGPNRKDTLLDKLTKLQNKQFPLLHHDNTQDILNDIGFDASKAAQCYYMFSSLYIPKDYDTTLLPLAYQKCIVGYWVHYKSLVLEDDCMYAIPSKKSWLLPPHLITSWFSPIEIAPKISEDIQNKRAPQLYKKKGTLIEKFFVVWW